MRARKKIAIISTDISLQGQLESYLSGIGHRIKVVQNYGDELTALVESFDPDLVIVDPEVPGLTGVEISLYLRRISPMPILMLSSYRAAKNQLRLLDTGSADYLSRPLGFPDIAARIDRILSLNGEEKDEIDIFGS